MVLSYLFKKLRDLYPVRDDLHVIMYTRAGCHLCDDAWAELSQAQACYRFHLAKQDVDADPELVAQFSDCVPVVTINGKVRFRGRINSVLLYRLLDAAPRT